MYMLRKLLLNIGDLPAQTSHILFNYLVKQQTYIFICYSVLFRLSVKNLKILAS